MKEQRFDQLELRLKTLESMLKGLSLPELFSVQDLLSQTIKDKCANVQSEHIKTMKLYDETQKLLQASSDESIRLKKECLYLSSRVQYHCQLNRNMQNRSQTNKSVFRT